MSARMKILSTPAPGGVVLTFLNGYRSVKAPVIVPDAQLDFWADFYLANPWLRSRGLSFESFLNHAVRNGALFEKLRHHRNRRHGRSGLRPLGRGQS